MKTAVSIPDPVFAEAEALAQKLGITRSSLYTRALGAFVASNAPDRLTEAMDAAIDAAAEPDDGFTRQGARRVFQHTEW